MISSLKENEIFVFGSNLNGSHGAGAALQALQWGAVDGQGEGLQGQTYALPTLGKDMQQRNDEQLTMSVRKLFKVARINSDKKFFLTKVGCGIAGYDEAYMKGKFTVKARPENIILPEDWN